MATMTVAPPASDVELGIDLAKLDGAVALANLGRGTQLYAPGDPSDRLFLLSRGRVKISVSGPGGKNCLFHIVEPGELFGEASLLGENQRNASAEVLDPVSVTMAPAKSVLAWAKRHPEFWLSFAPLLQKRMRNLEEQLQWVSFLEVEQRIARLFLRWASADGVEIELSQKDLAGLVGATRETTSSALNRLQRDGCVVIRRRRVEIESIEKLREHVGNLTGDKEPTPALVRVHHAGD